MIRRAVERFKQPPCYHPPMNKNNLAQLFFLLLFPGLFFYSSAVADGMPAFMFYPLLGAIDGRRRATIGAMSFIRRLWDRLRRRCPECGARPVYWDEECWWCSVCD